MALTDKQKNFVNEYLIDLNATQAYKRAGYSASSDAIAATEGFKLLRNPKIENEISKRIKEREHRTEITQDEVLRELAAIAFADITDFVEIEDGNVKIRNTGLIPKEKLRAVTGIKEGANGIEVKLGSKEKTLELLGRHLGMFRDKVEVSGMDKEKAKLDCILSQLRGDG